MKLGTIVIAVVIAVPLLLFITNRRLGELELTSSLSAPSIYNSATAMSTSTNSDSEEIIPMVSFSLAAIVRRNESPGQEQEYVLVHEKPPRGWWLPGGGIEHHDETPVDAAIREAVEEAGSPSLLPLIPLSQSTAEENEPKLRLLPTMTHLISLEQSPGRLRFIFRGEWTDDFVDNCDNQTDRPRDQKSILKCHRDEESIEAKWVTWNEVQSFEEIKRGAQVKIELPQKELTAASQTKIQSMGDPWLRGHEPLTFFQILEKARRKNRSVPGLPVHRMELSREQHHAQQQENVMGAYFGRRPPLDGSNSSLSFHGRRAALLTHLKCHLLIYDKSKKKIAIDAISKRLPSSIVNDQDEMTLKQQVDEMIADLITIREKSTSQDRQPFGLLRVEYIIHDNGREADLTVFPFVCLSSIDGTCLSENATKLMTWASGEGMSDKLERNLAEAVVSDDREICDGILRDQEGPLYLAS